VRDVHSSNDGVGKNEVNSNIACTHSSESKKKRRKKIKNTKNQVVMGSV
jgi:hypothetical protein